MVDDQLYLQQGALCEQCHVPLVPAQNFQQQWGQQPMMDGQWGQQPMQQPMMDGQWGQQPMQQPMMDGQWGQQPMMGNQYGAQATMAMNAPFAQQANMGMDAQFGQQPPMDAQFGQQPPMDVQFGQQPPMDAQFGQQPIGAQNQWGTQAQWSQMADKPMETVALMDPVAPQPVNHGGDAGEKTMAIDADWESAGAALAAKMNGNNKNDGWDDWDGKSKNNAPGPTKALPKPSQKNAQKPSGCITVGHQMDPVANENVTREIDLADVQKLYGDKVNPFKEFILSIPSKYFIIAGSILGATIILFIVLAIVISQPEEVEKTFTKEGDLITEDTPEPVMSFDDRVKATKELSSNFFTFDGDDIMDGALAAVTKSGIYYNNKKIAEYDDVARGGESVEKIIEALNADVENIGKPAVVLFDDMTPMHAVYRTLYSFQAASRKALIGGTTPSGITSFEVFPCEWPDYGMVSISDGKCKESTLHLKITSSKLTLRRINSNESLLLDEDNIVTELQDDITGSRVNIQNTSEAFNRMRIKNRPPIQLAPDGDVPLSIFMRVALVVRGQESNPNTKMIYLNRVSKY